jgi:O-antigen ligase
MMLNLHRLAFWSILIFVFVLPWERNVAVPGGAIGTPIGVIALLLAAATIFSNGKLSLRPPSTLLALMGLFVAWSAVSYFWSINSTATLTRTMTYAQILVMVWLIWQFFRTKEDFRKMLQAYVLGCYFAIAAVLINYLRGEGGRFYGSIERFSFAGEDPNYFALTLVLGLPMAWYLFIQERPSSLPLFNIFFLPLSLVAVGLTGSRGGTLAAIAALSVIPLTYWTLGFWRKVLLIVTLALAGYLTLVLVPETIFQRLISTPEDIVSEDLAGRQNIWRAGVMFLLENEVRLIFGTGSGTFAYAIEPIHGRARTAHNAYLGVLVDNGMVGFLLFVTCFLVALIPNLATASSMRGLSLALFLSLAIGIFALSWEREKVMWFILALLTTHRAFVLSPPSLRIGQPAKHKRAILKTTLSLRYGINDPKSAGDNP